jgi:hypothetical protein
VRSRSIQKRWIQTVGITHNPLRATIEQFAAEGYTDMEANCPRCRLLRLRRIDQLPKILMGLTLDALARRLRFGEGGGSLQ